MKKNWLAVIRDHDLSVARIAVGKHNEMKVMFLSEYKPTGKINPSSGEIFSQDLAGIKTWLHRNHVPLKKLKLAVSSLGLITRVIALPQMTNDDLEMLITDHIDQYFTLNVQNYIIDYRILNKYWENERPMINVLLAAFPRERMESVWLLCQYLGFEPMVVDLTADCLARLYANLIEKVQKTRSPDSQPGAFPGDMAIVSLHVDKVEFVLLDNGTFFLYSDMELDLQAISDRLDKLIKLGTNSQTSPEDTIQSNEPMPADNTYRQEAILQHDDTVSEEEIEPENVIQLDNENIPEDDTIQVEKSIQEDNNNIENEYPLEDETVPEEETPQIDEALNENKSIQKRINDNESISPVMVQPRWGTLIFAADTGEIKLNLSSYTDDIQLFSAKETGYEDIKSSYPVEIREEELGPDIGYISEPFLEDELGSKAGTQDTQEVQFENVDELSAPAAWFERDQLLNQLIGLEESNQDLLMAKENVALFDWDSTEKSFFETEATNGFMDIQDNIDSKSEKLMLEDSVEDPTEIDRIFFDEIDKELTGLFIDESADADVQFPEELEIDCVELTDEEDVKEQMACQDGTEEQSLQSQEDLFDLTGDEVFLDLAKALPQLDFSLDLQEDQPEPVELLDLGKRGLSFDETDTVMQDDSILEVEEEKNGTENNFFDEDPIWFGEDEDKDDGKTGYRQAAITISPHKEQMEEFVLEDLFISLENLDEGLAITLTKQDLAKQEDLTEQLTETLAEVSPAEMMEQQDSDYDQYFSGEDDLGLNSSLEEDNGDETSLDSFDKPDGDQDIFDSLADLQEISLGDIPEISLGDLQISEYLNNEQPSADETGDLSQRLQVTTIPNMAEPYSQIEDFKEDLEGNRDGSQVLDTKIGADERNIFDNLDLATMIAGGMDKTDAGLSDRNPKEELEISLSPVVATLSELLSFFAARHFGQTVHTVYLTGEFSDLPGLEEIFQENLGIRTKAGFPDGWKPQFEGSSKAHAVQWQKYGSLYGLALRED